MLQTFNDLHREHQTRRGLSSFVLWMFIETTIGIFREHLRLMEGNAMKNMFMTFRWPALLSLLLIVPFMIMELVNRRGLKDGFPILLFILMWILPLIFILTITPIIRNVRAGNSLIAQPVNLLIRFLVLIIVAWMWTTLLVDQMPCFLGVPNCD